MWSVCSCAVVTYVSEDSANAAVSAADNNDVVHLHNRSKATATCLSVCLSVSLSVYAQSRLCQLFQFSDRKA